LRKPLALLIAFAGLLNSGLYAMGFTEDPQEKLTKTFVLAPVRTLEIRGEIEFELLPGPTPQVTVEASRALFDQLNVSNWWGSATIAIESGLRGPREQGSVKIKVTLPSLQELTVTDHSTGHVVWPGTQGALRITEASAAVIELAGTDFSVSTSWMTRVILKGQSTKLRLDLRHQSQIDTRELAADEVQIALDESSVLESGPIVQGSGTVRHLSRITVAGEKGWEPLEVKEGSVKVVRGEATAKPDAPPAPEN